jgi:hypothetical protein
MSNISINSKNFNRYTKRLQKNAEKYGLKMTLAQAQELFSETLGAANYFEMQTILEKESTLPVSSLNDPLLVADKMLPLTRPSHEWEDGTVLYRTLDGNLIPYTPLETVQKSREAVFIQKYKEIINNETAIAKSCIYVDFGNMIIDIIGWNEGQCYSIYFGSEHIENLDDFKQLGIPLETSQKLVKLFNEYNPVEKYAGLLFGSNVRKLMQEESGGHDNVYFKNKLFTYEKMINGSVYSKRYMVVTDQGFKSIVKKLHPSGEYCIMRSERYPGFCEADKEIALEQIKKNDSIVIEYYSETGVDLPKCLLTRFWTSIDGVIQEYKPEDYKLDLHS